MPICANQSGFRPKVIQSRIMMQRRLQKSGFLYLPRRHMTKEFMSVAGALILSWWYCGACVRHPRGFPIVWRVVIANLKEREIGNTETNPKPIVLYRITPSTQHPPYPSYHQWHRTRPLYHLPAAAEWLRLLFQSHPTWLPRRRWARISSPYSPFWSYPHSCCCCYGTSYHFGPLQATC